MEQEGQKFYSVLAERGGNNLPLISKFGGWAGSTKLCPRSHFNKNTLFLSQQGGTLPAAPVAGIIRLVSV